MMKILIADDDKELCLLLKDYLSQEGFEVEMVFDGESAIRCATIKDFDLMILDVMMPQKNGFEALGEIRQQSDLPVIMLTARGEKVDRIVGLEMGADDYVAKPCDPRELVARIRAVTRRTTQQKSVKSESTKFDINGLHLDLGNRQVILDDQEIECTTTEFEILTLLVKNAGQLVSKEAISEQCLGKKLQAFDRSIDMHLSNLRRKLGDVSESKPRIKTVRGSGYQYLVWSE